MHEARLRTTGVTEDTACACRPSVSCSGGTQRSWSLSSTQATPCCCKLLPCPSRSRQTIQLPISWLLSKPLACRSLPVHAAQSSLLLQQQDWVLSTRMCKCVVCCVTYSFAWGGWRDHSHLAKQSINPFMHQSISPSINQSINQSVSHSVGRSVIQSIASLNQSASQSVSQLINHFQSVKSCVNQSTHQLILCLWDLIRGATYNDWKNNVALTIMCQ